MLIAFGDFPCLGWLKGNAAVQVKVSFRVDAGILELGLFLCIGTLLPGLLRGVPGFFF